MADEPRVDEQEQDGSAGNRNGRKALAPDDPVMRTAIVGTCVILWILAVFMTLSANRVKAELAAIRSGLEFLMSTSGGANVNGVTLVGKDGTTVYTLRRPDPLPRTGVCSVDGCSGAEGKCGHGSAANDGAAE